VMGWCVKYFISSLSGDVGLSQSEQFWDSFTSSYQPMFFHLIAMSIGSYVIYKGVVRGIEKANKIIIPSLLVLLILAAIRALTLPGAMEGLNFLFKPELDRLLNYRTWLEALSQSAWSTGAGWGLILTYAVYMKKREDIVLNSFLAGLGNNSASLLAGIVILPTIFALLPYEKAMEAVGAGNTGLTFIWIPQLFKQMPLGSFFMVVFFLALTFAAISSLISMIELATRIFMDAGLDRPHAILFVGTFGFLLGIPSAYSVSFLDNQDWVWGLGLIISGMFFAFAAIKYGVDKFRTNLINTEGNDLAAGKWFNFIVTFLIPIEFVVMLGWWFWQAATVYDPEGWWHPFHTNSVGTCLLQWGVVIIIFILFNRWIANRTLGKEQI